MYSEVRRMPKLGSLELRIEKGWAKSKEIPSTRKKLKLAAGDILRGGSVDLKRSSWV